MAVTPTDAAAVIPATMTASKENPSNATPRTEIEVAADTRPSALYVTSVRDRTSPTTVRTGLNSLSHPPLTALSTMDWSVGFKAVSTLNVSRELARVQR